MQIRLHPVPVPPGSDAQWLGTVTDTSGKGHLVLSTDGVYWMIRRGQRFALDQEAVSAALAHAVANPVQPGRPPLGDGPMLTRMVTLQASDIDRARQLGSGNVSAGIRAALRAYPDERSD